MELRRNETGLSLHYRSVRAPGAQELIDLFRIKVELVDQDDGSPRVVHLLEDRDVRVHFNQLWHVPPFFDNALFGCVNHNVCRTVRIANSTFAMASPAHSNEHTALIVGAGIGGLAAAIALRRAGWRVKIFERAATARELGFALLLAPNAISALRHLGLADIVIAGGARVTGAEMRRLDGRLLRTFDATNVLQLLPEPPVVVLRPVLHGALLEAVGSDTLVLGKGALGFEHCDAGVLLKLTDGTTVHGNVLIGADGIGSTIRRVLHPAEPPHRPSGLFALRGVVKGIQQQLGGLSGLQYFGRGTEAGIAKAGEDSIYWYLSMPADYVRRGPLEPMQVAHRVSADFEERFQTIVRATHPEDIRLDELFDRDPIRVWGKRCVTLLGDAAHPMLPHAGQGAAQALEDAVTLGHTLEFAENNEAALRRYEQLRFARTRKVVLTARRNARLASVRSAIGCRLRDLVIRLVPRTIIARSYVAFGSPPEPL
jgi:2-polyprenyl-6-methoxyphenol hydroxylase-like FAD-dependent oxidoreductase